MRPKMCFWALDHVDAILPQKQLSGRLAGIGGCSADMAKRRSYFRRQFSHTWKETEISDVVIADVVGGVMTVFLALIFGVVDWGEVRELIFLAVGGALIALIASFAYRFFCVTPAKIDSQIRRQLENAESKLRRQNQADWVKIEDLEASDETQNEPPKTRTPIVTLILVCLVTSLTMLLTVQRFQILRLKNPPQERSTSANPTNPPLIIAAKPLPTKVVARPEPAPPLYTQQIASVETQMPLERFDMPTGGVESVGERITKLKAEQEAQHQAETVQKNLRIQKNWDSERTHYQYALVELHDALNKELTNGDGIAQSQDYFQCLPKSIDPKTGELKVAQIGLQKNTNMEFVVSLTELKGGDNRVLIISGKGCSLKFNEGDNWFSETLHVDKLNLDDDKHSPMDKADQAISDSISDLIDAQKWVLTSTNTIN